MEGGQKTSDWTNCKGQLALTVLGDSLLDRPTCRVCNGYTDNLEFPIGMQGRKCRSCELGAKKKGKQQKQQHINGTESILLNGCTSRSVRKFDQ
ncbi:hypothetical protein TNCV_2322471 [Trichonephila clavipes]|nr:hypothetical protein TNCV_2322471 [Trichonephila clavipes]